MASIKMAVFSVVVACSLLKVYRRFALMTKAASASEMSANFYQTTLRKPHKTDIFK